MTTKTTQTINVLYTEEFRDKIIDCFASLQKESNFNYEDIFIVLANKTSCDEEDLQKIQSIKEDFCV